eukprot:SM000007S20840  [mRNA]  locus=s7:486412:491929:+ [translate_table: standard]
MSMDFHPYQQTLLLGSAILGPALASSHLLNTPARELLRADGVSWVSSSSAVRAAYTVGTNSGDVAIWEVGSPEKLVQTSFQLWEPTQCSPMLQAALVKEHAVSVNRVIWEPNGTLLGVAFSKHVVHIYMYQPLQTSHLVQHLEIDAHIGSVNDLAFSHPNKQLCVITCGDDKTIKVWDAATGRKQYTFEGHEAPVYSVCPHHKENIQFIFSTAIDGKIKAWLYDHLGSRVDYDAPGKGCTTMAYSADGTRLFSCGTSRDGESSLVEWNESEGAIKRRFAGFRKRLQGVVQFDTTRNRFLAAGDEFLVKFWDMDNDNVLLTLDADGNLLPKPRLRFNREGSLLAVTASENTVKILANDAGMRLLRHLEAARPADTPTAKVVLPLPASGSSLTIAVPPSHSVPASGERSSPVAVLNIQQNGAADTERARPRAGTLEDGVSERSSKQYKLAEVADASQCRTTRLPDSLPASKVSRLIYTNSGVALLALASNAVHKLWKWQRNERNQSGKVVLSPLRQASAVGVLLLAAEQPWVLILQKAMATSPPQLWQPASGILMTNDIAGDTTDEDAVPCIALSKNDSYVMSASGGKVSLFNMLTFKVMTTFMAPPPAATFLAFHPQDNNIIAIGMDDSTIQIYNVRLDEVKSKLKGHQKRITGLAFSNALNVLVSSGADAQLYVWGTDGWEKRKMKSLMNAVGRTVLNAGDTRVQFHNDQLRILVVHESQLAVYDAAKLERLRQWVPTNGALSAPVSAAVYSCDSQLVFAGFVDGSACVFEAETLRPRCRIASAIHTPSPGNSLAYPMVVAAHPSEPNQFSLGLSDGGVQVIEPLESEGKWGSGLPPENGNGGLPGATQTGSQNAD